MDSNNLRSICAKIFDLSQEDIELSVHRLSGISNQIAKVEIRLNKVEETLYVLFKQFGLISKIVDRDLETQIITHLANKGLGPKVFLTDNQIYRAEEYIQDTRSLRNSQCLLPGILNQVFNYFYELTSLGGFKFSSSIIQNETKLNYMGRLYETNTTNYMSFLRDMRQIAVEKINKFKEDFDNMATNHLSKEEIAKARSEVNEFANVVYNCEEYIKILTPEKSFLVLSHNDAHPGNILYHEQTDKIYLIDHEYASYNLFGFDLLDYFIETIYTLDAPEYPFWERFSKFDEIFTHKYFKIYEEFCNGFFLRFGSEMTLTGIDIEKIKLEVLKEDYYRRVISISSVYWSVFAAVYLDYEDWRKGQTYNYLSSGLDRYKIALFCFPNLNKNQKDI